MTIVRTGAGGAFD